MKLGRGLLTLRSGLIASFGMTVFLTLLLIYILARPYFTAPSAHSRIEIMRDMKPIQVPAIITAGQDFKYRMSGEKLVDNVAEVQKQLVCSNDGVQSYVSLGTTFSPIPKGKFDLERSMVIPIAQRVQTSESCRIDFIASYVYYQSNRNGEERVIPIQVFNRSNNFKLIVP